MTKTQGRRVDINSGFEPGDYGQDADGRWIARSPHPDLHLGDLSNHEVTEHEDGTITVSPSILITQGEQSWHGYLKRGVWEEC